MHDYAVDVEKNSSWTESRYEDVNAVLWIRIEFFGSGFSFDGGFGSSSERVRECELLRQLESKRKSEREKKI